MSFKLLWTHEARQNLKELEDNPASRKQYKAVCKALAYLEQNPRHPGLNTHKFESLSRECGKEIFEAYAENKTPGAYRIFWCYGPSRSEMTIIAITPHP